MVPCPSPPASPVSNLSLFLRACIGKRLWSPGIDSSESIPSAYVAWRASTKIKIAVPARQAGNRFLGSSKRPTNTGSVFLCVAGQAYSTDGRGDGEGAKSYEGEKAWSSIIR